MPATWLQPTEPKPAQELKGAGRNGGRSGSVLSLPSSGSQSANMSATKTVRSKCSAKSGLSLPSPDKSTGSKTKTRAPTSGFKKSKDSDRLSLPDLDQISNAFPSSASVLDLPSPCSKSTCPRDQPCKNQFSEAKQAQNTGSTDNPRKRFRAAKHEAFRKNRRIQEVIQFQNSKYNRVNAPANQGLGGLPKFPASNLKVPWWTCSFCSFQIFKHETDKKNDPYNARNQHLRNAHGTTPTPLAKGGLLDNPSRLDKANQGLAQRWKEKYALFQKKKWNGAHDIGPDPDHWRQYTAKATGNVWTKALYKCRKCGICVSSADIPHHPCKLAKGPIPSLAKRKEAIWKSCNPPVLHPGRKTQSSRPKPETVEKQSTGRSSLSKQARGTAPTSRGLRGVRVGEASHPGPGAETSQHKHHLKIWSQNIRSWHTNGHALLSQAAEEGVFVIALQETNVTDLASPSMANLCHRIGWQVAHVAPSPKHQGGVAILCRKPCALLDLDRYSGPEGQYIMVQVHAGQRVFNMYSHYRHATDSEFANLHAICEHVELDNTKDWCIALDGNANMLQGPCQELITRVGGTCVATAGHKRSSCPIDGIWVSPKLEVISAHNKPGDGDHGIAEVSLNLKVPKILERLWRFSHTPKIVFPEENDPQVPWSEVATSNSSWRLSLNHVECAWDTWSSDVTKWLYANNFVASKTWERNLGTIPHVKHSSHRMGAEQDIQERQLRRWIRRLQEAHELARRGKNLPETLRNRLQASKVPLDECEAAQNHRWGLANKLAQERLHTMLKAKQSQKLRDWKTKMHTLTGACRWLRQEAPIPHVLCNAQGQILTCAITMATELKNFWRDLSGTR